MNSAVRVLSLSSLVLICTTAQANTDQRLFQDGFVLASQLNTYIDLSAIDNVGNHTFKVTPYGNEPGVKLVQMKTKTTPQNRIKSVSTHYDYTLNTVIVDCNKMTVQPIGAYATLWNGQKVVDCPVDRKIYPLYRFSTRSEAKSFWEANPNIQVSSVFYSNSSLNICNQPIIDDRPTQTQSKTFKLKDIFKKF